MTRVSGETAQCTERCLQPADHGVQRRNEVGEIGALVTQRQPAVQAWVDALEIAGPGFINLRLKAAAKQAIVGEVLGAGDRFGRGPARTGQVLVEFVSANPTGPLHVGHGRQAALGDVISALLEWQGWRVTREFYYNDAGNQIANLAQSVQARIKQDRGDKVEMPKDGYHGDYIREIAREYVAAHFGDAHGENADQVRQFSVDYLRREQDIDLHAFGVKFDSYFLESSLYTDGKVEETVKRWRGPPTITSRCGCAPPTSATTRTA